MKTIKNLKLIKSFLFLSIMLVLFAEGTAFTVAGNASYYGISFDHLALTTSSPYEAGSAEDLSSDSVTDKSSPSQLAAGVVTNGFRATGAWLWVVLLALIVVGGIIYKSSRLHKAS